MKKEELRNYIACYKCGKEWRLITTELSTLKHAEKLAAVYKSHKYKIKTIQLELE